MPNDSLRPTCHLRLAQSARDDINAPALQQWWCPNGVVPYDKNGEPIMQDGEWRYLETVYA